MDCIFCERFSQNSINILHDEHIKHFTFYWDEFPVTPGHLLIIPNRHIQSFRDLSGDELEELPRAIKHGYKVLEKQDFVQLYTYFLENYENERPRAYMGQALEAAKLHSSKPDAYNHGLNDGEAAGQTVGHVHYHLMPRWKGDVGDPRGGVRSIIPGKGNYHKEISSD